MKEKANNIFNTLREKTQQVLSEGTEKTQQVLSEGTEKAKQVLSEGTEKTQQVLSEGTEKAKQVLSEGTEKAKQVISEGTEKAYSLTENIDILMILDKLLASPIVFKDKIAEKLLAIKEEFSEEMVALEEKEIKQKLAEKMIVLYTELAATSGDLLNMTNIIPGAFFAAMPAGITLFVKFPSELVMSLATIYDLDITDDDIKELCLILYISGALQEEKAVITPENIETYLKTVQEHLDHEDRKESIKESFNKFGKILTRKGIVNLTGASSEFSINKAFATFLGKQVNNYFQNHYLVEELSIIDIDK